MIRTLLGTAMVVATWHTALAQGAGPGACTGLVRTPDGSPLRDAEVVAFPRAATDDVVGAEGLAPRPEVMRTTTDAGGMFRLALPAPAILVVRHPSGLGVVWPRAATRDALRLVARPLAEVELPAGARGAHVRMASPLGELALGFWPGASLRLPGGAHRLLIEGPARGGGKDIPERAEVFVAVRGGESVRVRAPASAPWRVQLTAPGATVARETVAGETVAIVVDGWHGVALTPDADGSVALWPCAQSRRSLQVASPGPHGARRWQSLVVARDGDAPVLASTAWRALRVPGAEAVATLQTRAHGDVQGVAWSPVQAGIAHVPVVDDVAFVALRADGAVFAVGDAGTPIRAGTLTIAIRDAERPLAGALVELDGPPPQVRRRARTDSGGQATFVGVPRTRAFARLLHDELCSDDLEVPADAVDGAPLRLRARPGATLRGTITVVGDPTASMSAVEVTLRDPTGTDGLATRRAPVAADGGFAFRGLDADRRYTLFAALRRGAVTFSAKLHGVDTGAPVLLTLRSEDPLPPGSAERKR